MKGRVRKERSDKKRDCKPTLSVELKECIYRLSYITNKPVKDVAESICIEGINSKKILDGLAENFKRNIRIANTFYIGDLSREPIPKKISGETGRISIRFTQLTYENIFALAYALDCTPSRATALLLEYCIKDPDFIKSFLQKYLDSYLDEKRLKELEKILTFINENNPEEEEVSFMAIISYLFEELKDTSINMRKALCEWIDKYK